MRYYKTEIQEQTEALELALCRLQTAHPTRTSILACILGAYRKLDELCSEAASINWMLPEPLANCPIVGRSYKCSNCGCVYSALRDEETHSSTEKAVGLSWNYGLEVFVREGNKFEHYPVCSEDCELVFQRRLHLYQKERNDQWELLQVCRARLKEAKCYLRNQRNNQEVCKSPRTESETIATSLTS